MAGINSSDEDIEPVQDMEKEKNNFLAASDILTKLKRKKKCYELADVERYHLALNYLTAKAYDSEDTAVMLLQSGLENYNAVIGDRNGVNNYWGQIKSQLSDVDACRNPLKWKSALSDKNTALNFIKPLSCRKTNAFPCRGKSYTDKDIEDIINIFNKKNIPERKRKIPLQVQSTSQKPDKSKIFRELIVSDETSQVRNICKFNEKRSKSNIHQEKYNISNTHEIQSDARSQSYPNLTTYMHHTLPKSTKKENNVTTNIHAVFSNGLRIKPATSQHNDKDKTFNSFKSAREELHIQDMKNGRMKPTLGGRVPVNSQFVCPFKRDQEKSIEGSSLGNIKEEGKLKDEKLKNIDPKMIELIQNEIMDMGKSIIWDDIAGLEYTKKIIKEVVVLPMLRPDIFTGLRRPPKGILLFGPPGTGKTLIGKCIASQSKSTFFSISASSLTSKWIGEGEKMVRALFAVARCYQPSVIFIDEIDSLLTQRSETEHESSRRLKTEFLVQLDGAATSDEDRILIVAATNRPQELDEAARRRFVKRLYVPLPELEARKQIIKNLLASEQHDLKSEDIIEIAEKSAGYSGADMTNLCKEASMEPIRSIPPSQLENIKMEDVRHITNRDFEEALNNVRPSVSQSDLQVYVEWDHTYGSGTAQNIKT